MNALGIAILILALAPAGILAFEAIRRLVAIDEPEQIVGDWPHDRHLLRTREGE